jgi:type II secretory pathway component PulF
VVSNRNVALFCRQLATLIQSGVPIDRSLDTLGRSASTRGLRRIARDTKRRIEAGSSLAQALGAHSVHLPRLMLTIIEVGERTGRLDETFHATAAYYDNQWNLSRTVLTRLLPVLFYFAICGVLIVFIRYIYHGWDMTWLKRTALNIAFVVACIALFLFAIKVLPPVRTVVVRIIACLPIVAGIMRMSAISRFAFAMRACVQAGLDMRRGINLCANAMAHPPLAARVRRAVKHLDRGMTITESFRRTHVFDREVMAMVETGELGGRLDETMGHVAATARFRATTAAQAGVKILTTCIYVGMLLYVAYTVVMLWMRHYSSLTTILNS